MKKLFTILFATVLILGAAAAYTNQELIFHWLGSLLSATAPVEEPEPIVLHEAVELPGGQDAGSLEPTSDMRALALKITAGAANDKARMEAVYDWITANFAYDLEKLENITAFGAGAAYLLQTGKGICHDYADLAKALFTALGMEATYESGDVYPAPGKQERHAWNHVKVDGIWYAMDTTWGAGFVVEDEGRFIQKPRRLYLTTPEELYRLHRDPAYKDEREQAYRLEQAALAVTYTLPDYEQDLLTRFNAFRAGKGLTALSEERALTETARQAAARIAERSAAGEEYTLDTLKRQLEQLAPRLRIHKAGMYAFQQWAYEPASSAFLYEQLIRDQQEYLLQGEYSAATVAVVRKGDITVVVHLYLARF